MTCFLISVSVDPTTDVPERLKAFSAKFNAGPGWTFVTGDKQEINLLLKALGTNVGDKNDHSPMMLVGNESTAYWTRTYGLASVSTIVKVITDAAGKTKAKASAELMIGNIETGQWVKAFAMAKPAEIADQVIKLVEAKP